MMDRYDFRDSCTFFNLHMGRPIDWFGYMVISVIPGNTSRQDAPNDCCDCALKVGVEGVWTLSGGGPAERAVLLGGRVQALVPAAQGFPRAHQVRP